MPGTYIAADTPLIAVADEKARKFSNVSMSVNRMWQNAKIYMQSLMEKRYEVTYQPYDQSVYEKITTEGNVVILPL